MKAKVEIRDKEKKRMFTGTIEIPDDGKLHSYSLVDEQGNNLTVRVRHDAPDYLQCLLKTREDVNFVSFEFPGLETGKQRILFVGKNVPSWKFVRSPWTVAVTKLED